MSEESLPDGMAETPSLMPVRILTEYTYCPRLAYLEWVQAEFRESVDTLEGTLQHKRVDATSGEVPKPANGKAEAAGCDDGVEATSVVLSAPGAGLIGRIDLLRVVGDTATPVEYKHGRVPDTPERSWEPERVQLCAEGLMLRENGYECTSGLIYYTDSKTRVQVNFGTALEQRTCSLIAELRATAATGEIPPPLLDSPKCVRCSLAGICLPDEINLLSDRPHPRGDETRRLVPARDDGLPVYVQEQGSVVGKDGERLQVRCSGQVAAEARLLEVSQLCVFGNVQVTTPVLRELAARSIPICHYSLGGWFYAITSGIPHKNIELRQCQYSTASDEARSLSLAQAFVSGKIRNSRTILRRNHSDAPEGVVAELRRLALKAPVARDAATLLGIEGAAAKAYYSQFSGMLKGSAGSPFDFRSRNRRPPRDPVNALLSFLYALLVKDLTVTLLAVGFDPYLGFLHRPRYGRPALALDLAEEFRPLVADSVLLTLVNGGEIGSDDFLCRAGAVSLTPRGRRQTIRAYERRLDVLIRHPVFGYSISYRRVFEVQARLLARCLLGEIPAYLPFVTR